MQQFTRLTKGGLDRTLFMGFHDKKQLFRLVDKVFAVVNRAKVLSGVWAPESFPRDKNNLGIEFGALRLEMDISKQSCERINVGILYFGNEAAVAEPEYDYMVKWTGRKMVF